MNFLPGLVRMSVFVGATVASVCAWASSVTATLLPDPPKMGKQTVEFKVFDAKGKPSKETNVAVQAMMPATGSMPAMESVGKIETKGNGVFVGRFNVSMDGTWTLKITIGKGATAEVFDYQFSTGMKGLTRVENPVSNPAAAPVGPSGTPMFLPGNLEHHHH